ncbi:MAG: Mth938-like domain-containing protein [Acidobacteriota bacterium]|nr:Mth938-like domain-containing protein [Acidobacteriota bacterium]
MESYSFGRMVIDGRAYTSDLIIVGGEVFPNWWRKEGHRLQPEDLKTITERQPEVLVIGTGAHGIMSVPAETLKYLEEAGIEVISQPTGEAAETFNQITDRKKAAAFHLTC